MFVILLVAVVGTHSYSFRDEKHPYVGIIACQKARHTIKAMVNYAVPGDLTVTCKREHRA